MSDLTHEIDEELRQEKLAAFWRDNAAWIIGGIILAIVLTGALSYWRNYQAGKDMMATQQLLSAVHADDTAALDTLADTKGDMHNVFAALISAGRHARAGDTQDAVALYDKIAATRGVDDTYRDLAVLLSAAHKLDSATPAELHKMLDPLTKKSVWRFSALEMQALLYAREGRMDDATRALTMISVNAQAPADLRIRATTLRELYLGTDAKTTATK